MSETAIVLNDNSAVVKSAESKGFKAGLEGIVAATTTLSKVDGTAGRLIYRGYDVQDLARNAIYEEVVYLLWYGRLPNPTELEELQEKLAAERTLPASVLTTLRGLPATTQPMDALRTAVSAWSASSIEGAPSLDQAFALVSRMPVFLAAFHRLRQGLEPLESIPELSHAANYLYLLTGNIPSANHVKAMNAYLVLLSDHGMNASTFAARVVSSTESDMGSALVAAIGALKGPLHGGAPSKVKDMLLAIGSPDNAEAWLRDALSHNVRLMGFGHRIYKTEDPRSLPLQELAKLANPEVYELAHHVEETALLLLEEYKPGHNLYTNVEFYSAVLLDSLNLPGDLFTPTFAVGRSAGWSAHVLEQMVNNRLIRPAAEYKGQIDLVFVSIGQR